MNVVKFCCCFFFQAEDCIRDGTVTGVQTCALPILHVLEGVARNGVPVRLSRVYRIDHSIEEQSRLETEWTGSVEGLRTHHGSRQEMGTGGRERLDAQRSGRFKCAVAVQIFLEEQSSRLARVEHESCATSNRGRALDHAVDKCAVTRGDGDGQLVGARQASHKVQRIRTVYRRGNDAKDGGCAWIPE